MFASMYDCKCMHLLKYLVTSVNGTLKFLNLLKCDSEWWSIVGVMLESSVTTVVCLQYFYLPSRNFLKLIFYELLMHFKCLPVINF